MKTSAEHISPKLLEFELGHKADSTTANQLNL